MPAPAWTYSDWITYSSGDATRLSRLRLHIKEVADAISTGNYSVDNKTHEKDLLQRYLDRLIAQEKAEAAVADSKRVGWTRGKAL